VGPSGIAASSSPLGVPADSNGTTRVALAASDPRSSALYGAAWALAYVSQLAGTGIQALSLSGLARRGAVSAFPGDGVRIHDPAYLVLQRLTRASKALKTVVSDPSRLAALLLERDDGRELMVANLTGEGADITLDEWTSRHGMTVLDAQTLPEFANTDDPWHVLRRIVRSEIHLEPYAVASLVDVL
jgi:hypothetical protein